MPLTTLLIILAGFAAATYFASERRSLALSGGRGPSAGRLHSLPKYYGYYAALLTVLPALMVAFFWLSFEGTLIDRMVVDEMAALEPSLNEDQRILALNQIRNIAAGNTTASEPSANAALLAERFLTLRERSRFWMSILGGALAVIGAVIAWLQIRPDFRARNRVESLARALLFVAASIAVLTTVGIVFSVLFETIRFFDKVPVSEFLFGLEWSPQTAIRDDQVGASGAFGVIPLIVGTLLITAIAMFVAVPIGMMTAVYLSEYARAEFRSFAKPMLEVLAGIPTVVYGFFAALTVAPFIRDSGSILGLSVSSESALAAGLVMGIMIIPLVSSLSDDAISAVPAAMRDGSLGLGATRSETVRQVIVPAALPGIVGGVLLAVSRAIGETMIVVMAAGLAAKLTVNPLGRGHDRDGADRYVAAGRSGVRQRQDAGGVCARPDALRRNARPQCYWPDIRSSDVTGNNTSNSGMTADTKNLAGSIVEAGLARRRYRQARSVFKRRSVCSQPLSTALIFLACLLCDARSVQGIFGVRADLHCKLDVEYSSADVDSFGAGQREPRPGLRRFRRG